jgi:hypothetical protein
MLCTCLPLIFWQATFLPTGGPILEGALLFETVIVSSGAWLVWRYGGFEEAVTHVIERTRVFFPWGKDTPMGDQGSQASELSKFCRFCGAQIPRDATTCEMCHASLLRR